MNVRWENAVKRRAEQAKRIRENQQENEKAFKEKRAALVTCLVRFFESKNGKNAQKLIWEEPNGIMISNKIFIAQNIVAPCGISFYHLMNLGRRGRGYQPVGNVDQGISFLLKLEPTITPRRLLKRIRRQVDRLASR